MGISSLIMSQILAFFLVEGMIYKMLIMSFLTIFMFKNKVKIDSNKQILKNLIYALSIVIVNCLLTIDLRIINFLYLCVFSYVIYGFKLKIKIENYSSIYLLIIFLKGVFMIW